MTQTFARIGMGGLLSLAAVAAQAAGRQSLSQQNPPASVQEQQPAEKQPHVDQESSPESQQLEQAIKVDLQQAARTAYSQVTVLATDQEIVLGGTVLTNTAKQEAEYIAQQHANGKKVTNQIRVKGPGH
jgi:osmotically-inducible protein OsmY